MRKEILACIKELDEIITTYLTISDSKGRLFHI